MMTWTKRLIPLLFAAVAAPLLVTGCAEREVVYVRAPPPRQVVVVQRQPGWMWVPGHWARRHHEEVWVPGHWRRI